MKNTKFNFYKFVGRVPKEPLSRLLPDQLAFSHIYLNGREYVTDAAYMFARPAVQYPTELERGLLTKSDTLIRFTNIDFGSHERRLREGSTSAGTTFEASHVLEALQTTDFNYLQIGTTYLLPSVANKLMYWLLCHPDSVLHYSNDYFKAITCCDEATGEASYYCSARPETIEKDAVILKVR